MDYATRSNYSPRQNLDIKTNFKYQFKTHPKTSFLQEKSLRTYLKQRTETTKEFSPVSSGNAKRPHRFPSFQNVDTSGKLDWLIFFGLSRLFAADKYFYIVWIMIYWYKYTLTDIWGNSVFAQQWIHWIRVELERDSDFQFRDAIR